MSQRDGERGTPVDFAHYISGRFDLDGATDDAGNTVIKATPGTVRGVGGAIEDLGYEVEINDEADPPHILVKPSEEDLRAVADAHAEGIPEPGEALEVVDPVGRDSGASSPQNDEQAAAGAETVTTRSVEIEANEWTRGAEYLVHLGGRSPEVDRVLIEGIRSVLPAHGSVALENDRGRTFEVEIRIVEEEGEEVRVAEITQPASEEVPNPAV
jgi:hypothetical protein